MAISLTQKLLKAEKQRRNEGQGSGKIAKLLRVLSPKQVDFIQSTHRFKVAVAGRRGGKSFAIAAYCIIECLKSPNIPVLYLGLTRDSAKAAVWDILIGLLDGLEIPYEARPSALAIRFHNGSTITLFGGDTPNARNRLRGRKFKLIAADETGFFTGLDPLIYALLPTLADYQGTLIMASSPGETLTGLFYDAYQGVRKDEWRQWHWTLLDNPHFMKAASDPRWSSAGEEELDTICRLQFGGNRLHPAFQREYLGKYIHDDSNLVYPYNEKNLVSAAAPLHQPRYGIGVDLGSVSSNAIVICQFSEYSREVTIVEVWKEAGVSIDYLAGQISHFIDKYQPDIIVADTGGYGKGVVDEMRRRYQLPIRSADKPDKAFHQRIVANDLRSGYIKCIKGLQIVDEWAILVKDHETGDEVKGQENHASDAFLYIYRYLYTTYLKQQSVIETDELKMIRQLTESALRDKEQADEDRLDGYF